MTRKQLFKVNKYTGAKTLIDADTGRANGIAFGPDGYLYGCSSEVNGIVAWDSKTWSKKILGEGTKSNDIAILDDGTIFYTDPSTNSVWRLEAESYEREKAAALGWRPNGITLSLDQSDLLVAEFDSDTIHAFPIGKGSRLEGTSSAAFKLAVPSNDEGRLDGMQMYGDGRLLSGTALGLQIARPLDDRLSRPQLIVIPSPEGRPRCNYVRISPDGKWVYTAYAKDVLRRRLSLEFVSSGR